MKTVNPCPNETPLSLTQRCQGYYDKGDTEGPLTGYAGKYLDEKTGVEKHYVGKVFFNFAKVEEHGPALWHIALTLKTILESSDCAESFNNENCLGFCGAPLGGLALSAALAIATGKQNIFPEKRITALKTPHSREESELVFDRHQPVKGGEYWIVEDLGNNFTTTLKIIELLEKEGAKAKGLVCCFNRSMTVDNEFEVRPGYKIPIVAAMRKPTPQWRQVDPEVAEDVARGNVVWKPKTEWSRLAPFIN